MCRNWKTAAALVCETLASNAVDIATPQSFLCFVASETLRHDKLLQCASPATSHLSQAALLDSVSHTCSYFRPSSVPKEDAEPYRSCPKCDHRPTFGIGNGEGASLTIFDEVSLLSADCFSLLVTYRCCLSIPCNDERKLSFAWLRS